MALSTKRRRWLSWRGRAANSLLISQRARSMIEAPVAAFFLVVEGRFLIYDLDLQIGVEKLVIAKRMIGTVNAEEIAQATGVIDRSKQKSPRTASERCF